MFKTQTRRMCLRTGRCRECLDLPEMKQQGDGETSILRSFVVTSHPIILLTWINQPTKPMEPGDSSEVISCSAIHVLYGTVWNPRQPLWSISEVHYRVHKSPQLVSITSQMNPVQTTPLRFFKIHFTILASTFRSSQLSPPFFSPMRTTCPLHTILLELIILVLSGVQIMKRLVIFNSPNFLTFRPS
jgi:hypothetical protein